MNVPTDDQLRMFTFIAAALSAPLLVGLNWVKIRARLLTPGEVIVRMGFVALLISIVYGTGENLWGWYHLRLWILAVAVLWVLVGLVYMFAEHVQARRHRSA